LLLRAVNGLIPREIYARPKQGFTFPWERWLRVRLRPFADETLRDGSRLETLGLDPRVAAQLWERFLDHRGGITWSRMWSLVVLGEWANRHGVAA
jgi:asparagine synthase (glutamine-hydrolysing)